MGEQGCKRAVLLSLLVKSFDKQRVLLSLAIAAEALVRAIEAENHIIMHVQLIREVSVRGHIHFSFGNSGKRTLVDICD